MTQNSSPDSVRWSSCSFKNIYLSLVRTSFIGLTKPLKMIIIAWLHAAIYRWNSRRNLLCGLLCQHKKRKKNWNCQFSHFSASLSASKSILSSSPISFEWSPVSNLRKPLRLTKVNSSTGCFFLSSGVGRNFSRTAWWFRHLLLTGSPTQNKYQPRLTTPSPVKILVHCESNSKPQDLLKNWPLVHQIFSKCNPPFQEIGKFIQVCRHGNSSSHLVSVGSNMNYTDDIRFTTAAFFACLPIWGLVLRIDAID